MNTRDRQCILATAAALEGEACDRWMQDEPDDPRPEQRTRGNHLARHARNLRRYVERQEHHAQSKK